MNLETRVHFATPRLLSHMSDVVVLQKKAMLKSVGVVLVLWYISTLFSQTFSSMDRAGKATFDTLEAIARVSQEKIEIAK